MSYLELVRPNHVHRLCEVTIEFSTGTENGLILYMGDGSNDFLSLAMLNGHLEFRWVKLPRSANIAEILPTRQLN